MEETEDYSDIRLKSWCIHCGDSLSKVGWTEDHVPTKSLLQKPRPHHLPVIKVCPACNNSFSKDEQYFVTFLSCVMAGSTDPEVQFIPSAARALRSSPSLRAAIENARSVGPNREDASPTWSPDVERVHRVILKNARGHAFFERGEPVTDAPVSIIAVPLSTLSEQVRVWFERAAVQGALASWPEAGKPIDAAHRYRSRHARRMDRRPAGTLPLFTRGRRRWTRRALGDLELPRDRGSLDGYLFKVSPGYGIALQTIAGSVGLVQALPVATITRSAMARGDRVSHSQMTTTRHPKARSSSITRRSRATFPANLASQNSVLVFGIEALLQVCRCQKQP